MFKIGSLFRTLLAAVALIGSHFSCALAAESGDGHNYVSEDLTWLVPPPLPAGHFRFSVDLVDTESAKRSGDVVTFDVLTLQPVAINLPPLGRSSANTPPTIKILASVRSYQASCGWRTIRPISFSNLNGTTPATTKIFETTHDTFLGQNLQTNTIVDRLCAGLPLNAAQGARTVDDAIAFWKDHFGDRDFSKLYVTTAKPKPSPAAWMEGNHEHRFVLTFADDASGNMLFLDTTSLSRDGEKVSALSFVALGARAELSSLGSAGVVILRNVRYDCSARTLSVISTASWNKFGEFLGHDETPFSRRLASESPVSATDIASVCEPKSSYAQTFNSVDAAWAFARKSWPEFAVPAWVPCLWAQYSQDARARYFDEWRSLTAQQPPESGATPSYLGNMSPEVRAQLQHDQRIQPLKLPKVDPTAISACAAPAANSWNTQQLLDAYAIQRAALDVLSTHNIGEPEIKVAWKQEDQLERKKFMRSVSTLNVETVRERSEFLNRISERLGIGKFDASSRDQVEYYLIGEAKLEEF